MARAAQKHKAGFRLEEENSHYCPCTRYNEGPFGSGDCRKLLLHNSKHIHIKSNKTREPRAAAPVHTPSCKTRVVKLQIIRILFINEMKTATLVRNKVQRRKGMSSKRA